MATTYTANWAFAKPEVGASRDTWGGLVNGDLDSIDAILGAAMPIGALLDYAGATAPAGWLLCDGGSYPVASYPKLFAVIGARYGGDGVTHFNVPDLRGRVAAGVGTTTDANGTAGGWSLGQIGGYFQITLTAAQMPSIAITIDPVGDHSHTGYTDIQGGHNHGGVTDAPGDHTHSIPSMYVGGSVSIGTGPFAMGGTGITGGAGNHQHNISTTWDGNHQHAVQTYGGGGHAHTGRLAGGGAALPTYSPRIGVTKIIYAGPPTMTLAVSAPAPAGLMRSPMRGMH